MNKKFKKILALIMGCIIIFCLGGATYTYFEKDSKYKNLISKAENYMKDNNFESAKEEYKESILIKSSKDVDNKIKEIEDIEYSIKQVEEATKLINDKKFDEASKKINSVENKSSYVAEKIALVKSDIEKAKELAKAEESRKEEAKKEEEKTENNKEEKTVAQANNIDQEKSNVKNTGTKNKNTAFTARDAAISGFKLYMHKLPDKPYITPVSYKKVNGKTTVVEDPNSTIYYISMYPYTNKAYGGMTVETKKLTNDSYKILIRDYMYMESQSKGVVGVGTVYSDGRGVHQAH